MSKLSPSFTSNNINTIDEFKSQFVDDEVPHINKLRGPIINIQKFCLIILDILFQIYFRKKKDKIQFTFDGKAIVEWNIGGLFEFQLIQLLEKIGICYNIHLLMIVFKIYSLQILFHAKKYQKDQSLL